MLEPGTTTRRGAHAATCVAAALCSLSLAAYDKPSFAAPPPALLGAVAQATAVQPISDSANPMVGTWVGYLNDILVGCKFTADLAGCYTYFQPTWQPQRVQFKISGTEIEVQPEMTSNVQIYKMMDHDTMKIEAGDPRFLPDNLRRCPQDDPEACEAFGRHVFGLE